MGVRWQHLPTRSQKVAITIVTGKVRVTAKGAWPVEFWRWFLEHGDPRGKIYRQPTRVLFNICNQKEVRMYYKEEEEVGWSNKKSWSLAQPIFRSGDYLMMWLGPLRKEPATTWHVHAKKSPLVLSQVDSHTCTWVSAHWKTNSQIFQGQLDTGSKLTLTPRPSSCPRWSQRSQVLNASWSKSASSGPLLLVFISLITGIDVIGSWRKLYSGSLACKMS